MSAYDVVLIAMCSIGIDIITGFAKAFFGKGFNSTILRTGGKHKFAEIMALLFVLFLEYAFKKLDISIGFSIVDVTSGYIFVMECISILENIGEMNEKALPKKVKNLFEKLRKEI